MNVPEILLETVVITHQFVPLVLSYNVEPPAQRKFKKIEEPLM